MQHERFICDDSQLNIHSKIEVSLNIGLSSFVKASVVDEHAVSKATVWDVTGSHLILIRIYHTVFIFLDVILRILRILLLFVFEHFSFARCVFRIFLLVRFLVEATEKEVKHYSMHTDPPNKSLWIIALDEKQLECVDHYENELDHLQSRQIFLPP